MDAQPGVVQTPHALVRHVRRVMRRHGLRRAYLATDCDDPADLAHVNAKLRTVRMDRAPFEEGVWGGAEVANLEVVVCSMAAFFLGTKTSSYTHAIAQEREAVFGHAPETAAEMDADETRVVIAFAPLSALDTWGEHRAQMGGGLKDEL